MPSLICAHLPWQRLAEHRSFVLEERVAPEVFLTAESLDGMDWTVMAAFSAELAEHGLACTIHAPFIDLNPGSVDLSIREVTAHRVEQTLRAAELLNARVIVFHPGYSRLTYGSASDIWIDNSIRFWRNHLHRVRQIGCRIALENIFEDEPSTLKEVLEGVNDPAVGHCFDSGHFNMFSRVSLEEWFSALGSHVFESHLHDNHGDCDEHLPVGDGKINFERVTGLLHQYAPDAVWTLEAHSRERLERSRRAIQRYLKG